MEQKAIQFPHIWALLEVVLCCINCIKFIIVIQKGWIGGQLHQMCVIVPHKKNRAEKELCTSGIIF